MGTVRRREVGMTCPACGTPNDPGRKFCLECGAPLSRPCPSCGTPNPPQGKFCGECGTRLDEQPAPASARTAPADTTPTERRLVSVLFLDLVSFTALSEQHDAEDMREILSRYFELARTVIERHGGIVEKFIGDAVMAVWGTPVTHEDDAERAVRAALELVDGVAALGASTNTPLQARGGVLTGEAATMSGGELEGMVTGDLVNTASRLQSAAEPGTVFVGEATFRAASRAIAFEEVGELALKGKETPVRGWRALRVVAERQGANRMAIEPPFVGRTEELRLLKELLHATGRERKARVVSVTGIGGIGKSRLAWELLKYIDGLTDNVYWHTGRCPAYGEGVTFWALGEMVRMRAGIAETDPPSVSRTKLSDALAEYVPDDEERRWLEPRLAFLLGLEDRPAGGGEELFAAWRTFFERIADRGVVAMVFEDVQWADAGLLDFVESMLEWSRSRPILVVTLARPELADRRPIWGAGQRNFVALHLEPLPDDAIAELVRGMIRGASDQAVERIVARAEGVPLYAVETIRMLADRGVLRAGDDAYGIVGDLGELRMPETLHALVASRLDTLTPEDRSLLQDASVLGKTFTLAALAAISGKDVAEVEPRLVELGRKEFLEYQADSRSPERGQFGFVQGIIREVAHGMLSKADRRGRHLAAAHHLEAQNDDELASAVASHYVEALRATPEGPDADALAARARDWLAQASERATSLGSPEQALRLAQQALEITPNGVERASLLEQASRAAGNSLRRDDALEYLRQAVAVLRDVGDANAEVAMMGVLADKLGDRALVDELRTLVAEMQKRLGEDGDARARAEIELATAFLRYLEGDVAASFAATDRALGGFERAKAWDRFRVAIRVRAYVLDASDRHREAAMLRRGMLAVATEENDLQLMSGTLIAIALREDEARRVVERSLEAAAVARRGGYGEIEMTALANALEGAVESGAWETADELIADLGGRPDLPVELVDVVSFSRVVLAAYRGDDERAHEALNALSAKTLDTQDPTLQAWLGRVRAVVALMRDDLATSYELAMSSIAAEPTGPNAELSVMTGGHAASWLRDAGKARALLTAAEPSGLGWRMAVRTEIEAAIMALEGRTREASRNFEIVLAGRLAVGDRFLHAFMTADAVAVLPEDDVPEGAVEVARAYLEQLGAAPLLERLEPLRASASTDT